MQQCIHLARSLSIMPITYDMTDQDWFFNFFLGPLCHLSLLSPHYFKDVKISALALLKMVMLSCSGGRLEVMGLIIGKVNEPTMTVMDVFALPVEGTEMRVNAHEEAYEYMTTYTESCKRVREAGLKMGGGGRWRCGLIVASQCFVRAAVIIQVQSIYLHMGIL